jgi:hypothetical protein
MVPPAPEPAGPRDMPGPPEHAAVASATPATIPIVPTRPRLTADLLADVAGLVAAGAADQPL